MGDNDITIVISAVDKASDVLKSVKGKIEDMQPTFKKMAVAGGIAFGAITGVVYKSIDAYAEAEAQMLKVDGILQTLPEDALKSAGGMDVLKKSMDDVAQSNQKLGFDGEDTQLSLAKLFKATGDYNEALKLNSLAMDLARYKNVDLETATGALLKMNTGSTKELKAMGIEVDDNATKADNFAKVQGTVANQAKKYGESMRGATDEIKLGIEDLEKSIGKSFAPTMEKLLDKITPVIDKITKWIEKNPELTSQIIIVSGAIAGLLFVVGSLGVLLPLIIAGFAAIASPITIAIGLIIAFVITFREQIFKPIESFKEFASALEFVASVLWQRLTENMSYFYTNIKDNLFAVGEAIKKFFTNVLDAIQKKIKALMDEAAALVKSLPGGSVAQDIGNFFDFRKKESGGPVSGSTPYIVGERGPELFVPSTNGTVIPNNKMGSSININLSNSNFGQMGVQELETMFSRILRKSMIASS